VRIFVFIPAVAFRLHPRHAGFGVEYAVPISLVRSLALAAQLGCRLCISGLCCVVVKQSNWHANNLFESRRNAEMINLKRDGESTIRNQSVYLEAVRSV
jgi:hypothetical protein